MDSMKIWGRRGIGVLLLVLLAWPVGAVTFTSLRLVPRQTPDGFENARRYEVAYLGPNGRELNEPDFPSSLKIKEMDFILAGVARQLLDLEYAAVGRKADVQAVASTTADEILALVSGKHSFGAPAWDPANQETLARYLQTAPDSLHLYVMRVLVTRGDNESEEEVVPLLLRLKHCPGQRDLLTLFFLRREAEAITPAP
ncbi:MAG: hypothetical protein OZSIB_2556 [Candidatus Ozemobacter sibiricus]|jgi:hypothetical protein|uniref:Uncharacterized protein n=1 Tax=Candidatus Ozemobacter sibiricus TaxID=2268124 RepID=A0A367ZTZ5_9BACT|nr:MAG: hypothetical protein OZSIB_2556 [Candidatus Ozemobacter sibiricus]